MKKIPSQGGVSGSSSARTEPEDPSLPLNRPNTLPPFGWAPDLKQTSIIVSAGPQIKGLSLNAHICLVQYIFS